MADVAVGTLGIPGGAGWGAIRADMVRGWPMASPGPFPDRPVVQAPEGAKVSNCPSLPVM
jgi:hypothetical protein